MQNQYNTTRVAAVGDIHVRDSDAGKWIEFFKMVSADADVLLLCGDLTDHGLPAEAMVLAEELRACSIPVIGVLGNHDHDKGHETEIKEILTAAGMKLLDGEEVVIANVGFAGVKGFGGGFDRAMLSMFGESMMKKFVQEAVDEALKLEGALVRLGSDYSGLKKIAIMHYSPIVDTVMGEPEQIFPFLGSTRLAEPINNQGVIAAFHGHAHVGTLEGQTEKGVKVFNVSKPVLQREGFERPYFVYEVVHH